MKRDTARFVVRVLMLLTLLGVVAAMLGCTVVRYCPAAGPCVLVADVRLAGSAMDIQITRPDGTAVTITRDQDSPAPAIKAVTGFLRPPWRLSP